MSQTHKRKRSIPDSPVDLTKMQLARQRLLALQDELVCVEETTEEMAQIMDHVHALQEILGTTKKLVCLQDLVNLGIERNFLVIDKTVLAERLNARSSDHIERLCAQITRIYRFVSMQVGARMILDAILLTVAEISANGDAQIPVAIFPEMRLATGDGVQITNPATNFQVWLTGNADYVVCTYTDEEENRSKPPSKFPLSRVLKGALHDVMRFSQNRIVLVEGKQPEEDNNLYNSMPEAISQAAALSEVTGSNAVRFCLSDGRNWIFSLFTKDEQGRRVCYKGKIFNIIEPRPDAEAILRHDVSQVVELVYHWLVASDDPLHDPLYTLRED
ncbi:hypothetical protein BDZ89DRAFT_1014507 [Hymenopellis radicata]|nr:hypothetical protein BDZ89DRAFT_1014507 [Hymenopellis radicata]